MNKVTEEKIMMILSAIILVFVGMIIGYAHAMIKIHNFPIQ